GDNLDPTAGCGPVDEHSRMPKRIEHRLKVPVGYSRLADLKLELRHGRAVDPLAQKRRSDWCCENSYCAVRLRRCRVQSDPQQQGAEESLCTTHHILLEVRSPFAMSRRV